MYYNISAVLMFGLLKVRIFFPKRNSMELNRPIRVYNKIETKITSQSLCCLSESAIEYRMMKIVLYFNEIIIDVYTCLRIFTYMSIN